MTASESAQPEPETPATARGTLAAAEWGAACVRVALAALAGYSLAVYAVIMPLGHNDVLPLFRQMHASPALREPLLQCGSLTMATMLLLCAFATSTSRPFAHARQALGSVVGRVTGTVRRLHITHDDWVAGALALTALPAVMLPIYDLKARVYAGAALVGLATALWAGWRPSAPAETNERPAPMRLDRASLRSAALIGLGVSAFLAWISLRRHAAYWSSLIDLGLFYEQYDNAAGRLLYSPTLGMSFLGEHFSPLLALLAPVVWLIGSPVALLLIQAVSLGLGAAILWVYARDRLGGFWLPLMLALAWGISPINQQAAGYDFHMDMLEPPLVFAAALWMHSGHLWRVSACFVGLWCIKEDTFLYTGVLSLYAMVVRRQWKWGLLMGSISVLQAGVIIGWFLPMMRATATGEAFSTGGSEQGYAFAARFSHLGDSMSTIAGNVISNPWYLIGHLSQGTRVGSVLALTASFGFVVLRGRWRALLLLPALEMLLADPGAMGDFTYYYGAVVMPFGAIAAVESLRIQPPLAQAPGRHPFTLALASITAALLLLHPSSVFSLQPDARNWARTDRHARIDAYLAEIPQGVRVSATGYMAVHLQPDRDVRMLPWGLDEAEYAVYDLQSPAWPQSVEAGQNQLRRMLRSGDWALTVQDAGFFVLRRAADGVEPMGSDEVRALTSGWRMEAERTENTRFQSRSVRLPGASDGAALRVGTGDFRGEGHLFWGPWSKLASGEWRATWRMRWQDDTWLGVEADAVVATIDVFCAGELARAQLTAAELSDGAWHEPTLRFSTDVRTPACEYRLWYHDRGALTLDWVDVGPAAAAPAE